MRKFDVFSYKKIIAPDFFESTLPGAWLSIAGTLVLIMLFISELSAYMTVQLVTDVVMEQPDDSSKLRINFDVSLPNVPCQFAAVDVDDVLGRRRENVTTNVNKWRMEHKSGRLLGAVRANAPAPEYGHVDHDPDELIAEQLTDATFEDFVKSNEITLVNFYAPWCHWSKKLQPVWEHTAGVLKELDSNIKFGKVDCTDKAAHPTCHKNHVQAYPTIILFQAGATHSHAHYHGDRTTEALIAAIAEVRDKDPSKGPEFRAGARRLGVLKEEEKAPEPSPTPAPQAPVETAKDEPIAAKPEGCRISGILFVSRVPGALSISLHSEGHSFDPSAINTTHLVNNLYFGDPMYESQRSRLTEETLSMMNLQNKTFMSTAARTLHEHYIKVVGSAFRFANGEEVSALKFTTNSHSFVDDSRDPHIRFSYDLSPMTVVVTETSKSFLHFLTSACAIIGGVFTVIGLLDSFVYHGVKSVRKKMALGKQG